MSEQLVEEINKLMSSLPISSYRGSPEVGAEQPGTTEDVDAEANTYFHQMFSGQLSIEQMVQMLSRFKESADQRQALYFFLLLLLSILASASFYNLFVVDDWSFLFFGGFGFVVIILYFWVLISTLLS